MALHTLQNPEKFTDCCATLTATDTLLLIDRAVYLHRSPLLAACPCPIYVLAADLELAGLPTSAVQHDLWQLADYGQWVKLTEMHRQLINWA